MLFISKAPDYTHTIRGPDIEYHPATGQQIGKSPAIVAQFRHGATPEWMRDLGERIFTHTGLGVGVSARSRISHYDTDHEALLNGWSDRDKDLVETILTRQQSEYMRAVEAPKQPEPFPNYKKIRGSKGPGNSLASKIGDLVGQMGLDPKVVLAYERQEYGDSRPEVAQTLASLIARGDQEKLEPLLDPTDEELVRA